MRKVIHWHRRDLRVADNTALYEAWSESDRLVPLFIWEDPWVHTPDTGLPQAAFLRHSLISLRKNLEVLGYPLVVRRGTVPDAVVQTAMEAGASAVYTNRGYEPHERTAEARVRSALDAQGIEFVACKDGVIREERELLTGGRVPYTVFTPYCKAWRSLPLPDPIPKLPHARGPAPALTSHDNPVDGIFASGVEPAAAALGGEHSAHVALRRFLELGVDAYASSRDFPAIDGGVSNLSPHFRAGTIGIRTVLHHLKSLKPARDGAVRGRHVWETELVWREFYHQILANFPHVAERCMKPEYDAIEWPGGRDRFDAWVAGKTGYPLVDASMRCLNASGVLHNRLRMVVAMFLVKDLLVSWREGERHFMRTLLDADLAANNGGWQWSAGVGADAAPYFRIFNPVTQGKKFDPDAAFIRRWVPELADAPVEMAHEPWKNDLWRASRRYPERIVDHARQRIQCVSMFKEARRRAGKSSPETSATEEE
jgi:deoxyribodipyrimidine photo-lyase